MRTKNMRPSFLVIGIICALSAHNFPTGKSDQLKLQMCLYFHQTTPKLMPRKPTNHQDIEMNLRLNIFWNDPRLTIHPNASSSDAWKILSKAETNKMWTPSVIVLNCRGCPKYSVSTRDIALHKTTGTFSAQFRIHKEFSCPINLRAYPMDIQFCQLQIYTYQGFAENLKLKHLHPKSEVVIGSNLTLAEYIVSSVVKGNCLLRYADGFEFPCLELRIRLEHLIAFHLMTSYAPTTFIVALSWISFWLPVEQAPARVALGLTSLLTLATRLDQAQKDLPPVAYVKAIDVWMFACLFLVSASLCEFAISHYSSQISKTRSVVKVGPISGKNKAHVNSGDVSRKVHGSLFLDRVSRLLFPLMFLIFNVAYWSFYLTYYH